MSIYAPPDDLPHPLVFLGVWCAHVERRSRSIAPPPRQWAVRLAWLRERQQWIAEEQAYARDLAAVRATLRNVCHADRPSQAEQIADRWLRGQAAMRELQARWWEIDTPLTREEVETIWPDELDDEAWARIRKRKERARYRVPVNTYHPEWIAEELV